MKKMTMPLLLVATLFGCATNPENLSRSTASDHFGGHYDGPPIQGVDHHDMDRQGPPLFSYCEKYANATAKHVLTCTYAIQEAMSMAQKYAGGFGREEGYLRGYAWGMNKVERQVENDPNEIMAGERLADSYSSALNNAVAEGAASGSHDGDSLGSAEAKGRFYAAIDTKVMPTTNYTLPATSYQGISGASAKYIGRIPTAEEILQDSRYNRINIYESYDHDYMGRDRDGHDRRQFGSRDVWNNDGVYNHHAQSYLDGEEAFQTWLRLPIRSRQKYDLLNTVAFNEENFGRFPAQATEPPHGNGGGNHGGGNGGGGGTQPTIPPVTPPTTPPAPVAVDFQAIFKDAFVRAYSNYAPFQYNHNFYSNIDDGQRDGEIVGADIGRQIAQKKGMARAFDRQYLEASRSSYLSNFATSYTKSFSTTYNYYKNNSILTLNFMDIVGLDEDGIIQPGEDFSVRFKVTNVGGLAADLNYTVVGNVENAVSLKDSVAPISSKVITSSEIAAIDSSLSNGADASLTLEVNDMHEQLWKKIQRPVQIADVTPTLSSVDGSGLFSVIINNVSTVSTNGKISLELKLNGKVVKTVFGDALKAGEKKGFTLDFAGIDPLTWINGNVAAEIALKYNDAVYGSKAFNLTEGGKIDALGKYYDKLLNNVGVVPAGKSADDRIAEIRAMIVAKNVAEVAYERDNDGNVYRNSPGDTVPGKLALLKDSRNPQSQRALNDYASLADVFNNESKKFKSFLGIHPKRNAYQEVLSRLAGRKIK